jgi:hypothetical protein
MAKSNTELILMNETDVLPAVHKQKVNIEIEVR